MSNPNSLLSQSNPENIVTAPKGSIFSRKGEDFFLFKNGNVEKLKIKNFNNFCYYIKKGVLEPTFKDIETGFKLASLSNFKNN